MSDVGQSDEYVHQWPLERERSNYIVQCRMHDRDAYEQLWTRKIEEGVFEVCCIPLYVYGIALGDHITLSDGDSGFPSVVRRSGHHAYRIWFGGGAEFGNIPHASHDYVHEVLDRLRILGARTEIGSQHLLAVDASSPEVDSGVFEYLSNEEKLLKLSFEDALWERQFN